MFFVVYLGGKEGCEAAQSELDGFAIVRSVEPSYEAVKAVLKEANAVLDASMRVRFTEQMISSAPLLRVISCATTGSDHIDHDASATFGISIRTLREDQELLQDLTPAAELSWALVMACARNLIGAHAHVCAGEWVREEFPGVMLKGRTLGLIGCGRIGGWMARYGAAFGMKVLAYDPQQESLPDGVARESLRGLISSSDIISVHVHLTSETEGLVSAALFSEIKPGAIFVNTSRGGLIDEGALLAGLVSGRIAAAGLDVLQQEPDIRDDPLVAYARDNENLLITPHCGGFSPDAVRIVCARAAQKIRADLSS